MPAPPSPPEPNPRARLLGVGLAAAFAVLGLGILAAPRAASFVFGLPRQTRSARPYVRALAFRDLAMALALGLGLGRPRPTLSTLGASFAAVPLLDAVLVARRRGRRALPSVALHASSGAALLALALLSAPGRLRR